MATEVTVPELIVGKVAIEPSPLIYCEDVPVANANLFQSPQAVALVPICLQRFPLAVYASLIGSPPLISAPLP